MTDPTQFTPTDAAAAAEALEGSPASAAESDEATPAAISRRLYRDPSFWGLTVTQFLGAFNDNLFKQLMLLLAIRPGDSQSQGVDHQGLAQIIFSLPFVLASGFAGFLSDRYSKQRVIFWAKVAEIVVMGLGMIGFLYFGVTGYPGLLFVLFLMGLHSTFFGPGKYGILPELFERTDLPRANGVLLMTTFLAIILGTASAGAIKSGLSDGDLPLDRAAQNLWIGSAICIGIAVVGTITSLWIRWTRPAIPGLQLTDWTALFVPPESRRLLAVDRPLLHSLLASCVFWLVAGLTVSAVNSLGKEQLRVDEWVTSTLAATIGVGICVGAILAGRLSHGGASARMVRAGAIGIVILSLLMTLAPDHESLDQAPDTKKVLVLGPIYLILLALGASAALYAIPLQVFIQDRPPGDQKGRLIGAMNLANFIAIMLSGALYWILDQVIRAVDWPRSAVFGMMAFLMLPVAIWFRPNFRAARPVLTTG